MDRRGTTLFELLIAIGLLVAITAIAVPVVITSLEERAYDAAIDVSKAALLRARAHAQATGRPIEVTYHPDPPRITARAFDPATGGLDPEMDPEDAGAIIAEDWAHRPLASGVRFTREAPPRALGDTALDDPALAADLGAEIETYLEPEVEDMALRLAVYLPDGSAMLAEPVWIVADDGRRARLVVNPWSGLPGIDAAGAADPEADAEEEPEEEDEPEPERAPARAGAESTGDPGAAGDDDGDPDDG